MILFWCSKMVSSNQQSGTIDYLSLSLFTIYSPRYRLFLCSSNRRKKKAQHPFPARERRRGRHFFSRSIMLSPGLKRIELDSHLYSFLAEKPPEIRKGNQTSVGPSTRYFPYSLFGSPPKAKRRENWPITRCTFEFSKLPLIRPHAQRI